MTVIGIDFGSTNSCLSYYNTSTDLVCNIPDSQGTPTIPTLIAFHKYSNEITFNKTNHSGDYTIVRNFKRLLNTDTKYILIHYNNNENHKFTIESLIIIFLTHLKSIAETFLGNVISHIVITVPVHFSDTQRQIIKKICQDINLDVIRIINEPTSAVLAYSIQNINKPINENVLVIDSGGGTTDLSLISIDYHNTIYEVKAVHGNNNLGGEDLTTSLINYILQRLDITSPTPRQYEKIREQCEHAKHQLSFSENTSIFLENFYNNQDINIPLSRITFVNLNLPFFNKIKEYIRYISQDSGLSIDKVVFIGGTSRIPYFVQLVQNVLGKDICILNDIDPHQTVSIGACLQAAILTQQIQNETLGDTLLLDIVPFSIGIETEFGIMNTIISKWSSIPTSKSQIFTNTDDHINHIKINVYQGERKFVKDNILLGTFTLQELDTTLNRGDMQIKVTFDIDSDGILTVSALDMKDYKESSITVTYNSTQINTDDTDDIFKLEDSYRENQILAKNDLYNSFKFLLHTSNTKSTLNSFKEYCLNQLYNNTFNIIKDYEKYSVEFLKSTKITFQTKWHSIMFDLESSSTLSTKID